MRGLADSRMLSPAYSARLPDQHLLAGGNDTFSIGEPVNILDAGEHSCAGRMTTIDKARLTLVDSHAPDMDHWPEDEAVQITSAVFWWPEPCFVWLGSTGNACTIRRPGQRIHLAPMATIDGHQLARSEERRVGKE